MNEFISTEKGSGGSHGRYAPTEPLPYPGSEQSFVGAYSWNAPRQAQDGTFESIEAPTSALSALIAAYQRDTATYAKSREEREDEVIRQFFYTDERDPWLRDYFQERTLNLVRLEKEVQRHNPALVIQADLNAQPKFIRQPIQQRIDYLRNETSEDRVNAYLTEVVEQALSRLDVVREKQLSIPYRYMAGRLGLDSLLNLPKLHQKEIKTLCTKVAAHIEMLFVEQADQVMSDETPPDEMLKLYRTVAEEAGKLVTPPAYYELSDRPNRRKPIPYDLIPGALTRMCCAEWWYLKLWRLRCEWREAQLRAVCLVHKHASVYVSYDAIIHKREQRRKALEFFKAHNIVNDDGLTLDMESVIEASNSNLKNRRNEMMACVKGLELLAEMRHDCAMFYTITCPSKYHATLRNGKPNPKWNLTTPRESSDYLVNLFAGIRKKLSREDLRWYGIRVAEPHHDGTTHWHLLCFMRKKDRKAITKIMRDFAIRDDRAELGNDIKPRFQAELITKRKGTPTAYIAKYIAKNIDGANLPRTAKNQSKESGKQFRDTVENVATWASLHRVQQFRFFGIPSRQAYRELRLLAGQLTRNLAQQKKTNKGPLLADKQMDDVLAAADVGCFATYIAKQGGVLIPRQYHIVRTAYTLSDQPNDYGEFGQRIYGVWSPQRGEQSRICTHIDNWQRVRKTPGQEDAAIKIQGVGVSSFGGNAAPWTRGNNCPQQQNDNSSAAVDTGDNTPKNLNFGQLTRTERRDLLVRLQKAKPEREKQQISTGGDDKRRFNREVRAQKCPDIVDFAESIGLSLHEQDTWLLAQGQQVSINGQIWRANPDGSLRNVGRESDSTPDCVESAQQKIDSYRDKFGESEDVIQRLKSQAIPVHKIPPEVASQLETLRQMINRSRFNEK